MATKQVEQIRLGRQLRQEQILEEATRIIGELGYHGFSIQELARRCRITNAGLLYYFPSKDDLLLALLQHRVERDTAALAWLQDEVEARGRRTVGAVKLALRAVVQRSITQPEIVRFYAVLRGEALHHSHPAHSFFVQRINSSLETFTGMLSGQVTRARSKARQLLALMMGLEDQWLRGGQQLDLLKEWDLASNAILPEQEEQRAAAPQLAIRRKRAVRSR